MEGHDFVSELFTFVFDNNIFSRPANAFIPPPPVESREQTTPESENREPEPILEDRRYDLEEAKLNKFSEISSIISEFPRLRMQGNYNAMRNSIEVLQNNILTYKQLGGEKDSLDPVFSTAGQSHSLDSLWDYDPNL